MSADTRFNHLTFDSFKRFSKDDTLSCYEKIGFPDDYRRNKEQAIFQDYLLKLSNLNKRNQTIIEIGPGCSELPRMLIDLCEKNDNHLILIDSQEMLDLLPDKPFIKKIASFYPNECIGILSQYQTKIDVIVAYSVMQYIFVEANIFNFLDFSISLLADGGQMLIGDIPNASKRKRFLSSTNGIRHHQEHYEPQGIPTVKNFVIEHKNIDDAVIFSMLSRCRLAGFDAYIMPQAEELPMANRREDILIVKP